jgi:hypothetical protein
MSSVEDLKSGDRCVTMKQMAVHVSDAASYAR